MVIRSPFDRFVMAVERVERLLKLVTGALNDAGLDYAVIGGNAIATWVATVDEAAVRTTKDVDVLIRRTDLAAMSDVVRPLGLQPIEVLGVSMFVDEEHPNPKTGVHLVFGGERIREHHAHPAPDPSQSEMSPSGFRLLDLDALVAMKLQAFRFIDRAHVEDLLSVGLIDEDIRRSLPADLLVRLRAVENSDES
jgi:hypothetical protein